MMSHLTHPRHSFDVYVNEKASFSSSLFSHSIWGTSFLASLYFYSIRKRQPLYHILDYKYTQNEQNIDLDEHTVFVPTVPASSLPPSSLEIQKPFSTKIEEQSTRSIQSTKYKSHHQQGALSTGTRKRRRSFSFYCMEVSSVLSAADCETIDSARKSKH